MSNYYTYVENANEKVKLCRLDKFNLNETFYSPNSQSPEHTHETAHISFVMGGNYTERYGTKKRTIEPSTVIIHPPNESHSVDFYNRGARIFSIALHPAWFEYISDYTDLLNGGSVFARGKPSYLALRLYREFCKLDTLSPLIIEGLTIEIIGETSRKTKQPEKAVPRWLHRVRDLLQTNFLEIVNFADLTEISGVHPHHLAREFRRFYHCTMGEYVRRLRVEAACIDIVKSKTPFSEIALKYRFYDQSHFSNIFKQIVGVTPAQYRLAFD